MTHRRFVPTRNRTTWDDISARLRTFDPEIHIADFAAAGRTTLAIHVKDYPSEGIDFMVPRSRRTPLVELLSTARTRRGKQAFQRGRWQGALHAAKGMFGDLIGATGGGSWAADISYKATRGDGFREIWYPELSDRQLRLRSARPHFRDTPRLDPKFTAMFHAPNDSLDLSSLHFAIGDADPKSGVCKCNVHVDQVGIMANMGGGAALTTDTPYHTFVELAFRTGFKGLLPDFLLQRLDFVLPSSRENYALNFGVEFKMVQRKHINFAFRGICGIENGGLPWSLSLNLGGTHDVGGGR